MSARVISLTDFQGDNPLPPDVPRSLVVRGTGGEVLAEAGEAHGYEGAGAFAVVVSVSHDTGEVLGGAFRAVGKPDVVLTSIKISASKIWSTATRHSKLELNIRVMECRNWFSAPLTIFCL